MKLNEHEINYRSSKAFKKMQNSNICICGAGAIGSNLVNNLMRQGVNKITIIDMDRVEAKNVSTQIYTLSNVGQKKAHAVKSIIYQATKGVINVVDKELKLNNASKLLKGYDLVVDAFDNWKSRKVIKNFCEKNKIPCVHAGMSDDGFAEIKWNEIYSIPKVEVEQDDICDYPLAANLVHLTASVLAEVVIQFIVDNKKINKEITLKDVCLHAV